MVSQRRARVNAISVVAFQWLPPAQTGFPSSGRTALVQPAAGMRPAARWRWISASSEAGPERPAPPDTSQDWQNRPMPGTSCASRRDQRRPLSQPWTRSVRQLDNGASRPEGGW